MMIVDQMQEEDLRTLLTEVCDKLGIGKLVRNRTTIITNIENGRRRSACLSRIENIHTEMVDDEDTGEPEEHSLLDWGHEPDQYEARYREVIARNSE